MSCLPQLWQPHDPMKGLDQKHFLKLCATAEGYVALGLLTEANNLLEALPPEYRKGRRAMTIAISILAKQGEFLKASHLAEALSLNDPDNIAHKLLVARYRFKAGKVLDALWWLQAYAQKCAHSSDYHYFRAECHAAVGDPESAATALRKAHELEERPRWATSAPVPTSTPPAAPVTHTDAIKADPSAEPVNMLFLFSPQATTASF